MLRREYVEYSIRINRGNTVTLGTEKNGRNFGVAVVVKLLSIVYIVLNGTPKSGRYIEVAAILGWPLSGINISCISIYQRTYKRCSGLAVTYKTPRKIFNMNLWFYVIKYHVHNIDFPPKRIPLKLIMYIYVCSIL